MNSYTAFELAYKNGQMRTINDVEAYIKSALDEWHELGDRKYDPANIQVYNHLCKCLDDLEDYRSHIF